METTIVVTGATGRTGQEVIRSLLNCSHVHVRAAVHHPASIATLPQYIDVAQVEYDDPESVRIALAGAQRVFWVTPGGVDQVRYTRIMVEQAKVCGIKHIVKLGNISCDEEPILGTDVQCCQSELCIAGSGIPYTFLRGSWFNQIFAVGNLREQIHIGETFMMLCDGKTGWVDCRDLGQVAAKILTESGHHGKIYNLTGPELLSFEDIAAIMSRVAGRRIEFVALTEDVVRRMFCHEAPDLLEARVGCLTKMAGGYLAYLTDDIYQLLGRPPLTFEQFVRDYADALFSPAVDAHGLTEGDADLPMHHAIP